MLFEEGFCYLLEAITKDPDGGHAFLSGKSRDNVTIHLKDDSSIVADMT
jgi:hypothetical protein